jgi:hypothetical protein
MLERPRTSKRGDGCPGAGIAVKSRMGSSRASNSFRLTTRLEVSRGGEVGARGIDIITTDLVSSCSTCATHK